MIAHPPIPPRLRLATLLALALLAGPTVRAQRFAASPEWRPLQFQAARIAPGSALDFSPFLEAPAGKFGKVVCRDGQFTFAEAPGRPVHLYGVVIGGAMPYLDQPRCNQLADYLAACGYGAVRLHLYNNAKGVMQDVGSSEFTPAAEDELDYFFSCLKKRGIYYTLPLNAWGFFKAGDVTDVPEFRDRGFRFESNGLLPISQDARRWFRDYARHLLGHVNRYTGLALKDDPALLGIELTNEDSLLAVLGQYPVLVPIYRRKCQEELRATLGREPTPAEIDQALPLYVERKQDDFTRTMMAYLHGLGVSQPLTDLDFRDNLIYALPRERLDYTGVHSYWALYHVLPGQPRGGVYRQNFSNPNAIEWNNYLGPAAARLFGKPYMNTEYNGCYPTPYWVFTGPVEAVIAGSQGWNGIFRCGVGASPEAFFQPTPLRQIATSSPVMLLSERIAAILFSQGEIQALPVKLPFVVTADYLRAHATLAGGPRYPLEYQRLAFQVQLGTVVLEGKQDLTHYPAVVVPEDMALPPSLAGQKVFRADASLAQKVRELTVGPGAGATRLHFDAAAGSAQVVTPRSETFLLPAGVARAAGPAVQVAGNSSVAVCFAGSLDRRPLTESRRILALYLTDVKNTGTVLEPEAQPANSVIVRDPGTLPLLLRQGSVEFTFQHGGSALPEIWALRFDGSRGERIEPRRTAGGFGFSARAVTNPETFSAFELAWAPPPGDGS